MAVLTQGLLPLASPPVRRVHVWLARRPCLGLSSKLWLVITQAALLGMDKGRRTLTAFKLAARDPGGRHLPLPLREQIASRVAVATFWDMLTEFASLTPPGAVWLQRVPPAHPFLRVQSAAGGSLSLQVQRFT